MTAAALTSRASLFKCRISPVRRSLLQNQTFRVKGAVVNLSKTQEAKQIMLFRATSKKMVSLWACPKFTMRHLKGSQATKDNSWTTWLPASKCARATMADSGRSTWGDVQKNWKRNSNVCTIVVSHMLPTLPWTCIWGRSTMKLQRPRETARPGRSFELLVSRAILISSTSSRHSPKSSSNSFRRNYLSIPANRQE